MKSIYVVFAFVVFIGSHLLADSSKPACTCQAGGACTCPAGTCTCAAGEKKPACTCQAGGTCTCPEGKCTCAAGAKKEACTCQAGGACTCPEGTCTCAAAAAAKPEAEKKNCGCACCKGKEVCCCHADEASTAAAPAGHPLKGVVVDVVADKKSLLVKHEEIPGVMKAMTMLLHVDAATLSAVKKGDAITATLTNEDGAWWLHDVKRAAK